MINKRISKIALAMIVIFITFLLGTANIANAIELNLANRYIVCYKKDIPQGIRNGGTVELAEISGDTPETDNYVSALYLPHVYCAQHGEKVSGRVFYTAYGEYTVQDPILAYILAKNPPTWNVVETDYSTEPSQLALWYYLYSQNTTDKTRIMDGLSQYDTHEKGAKNCCRLFKQKNSLYLEAEEYAKNLNTKPTLTINLSGNTLKVTVGGYFENFDLIINGTAYSRTKNINRNYEENIDITNYSSSEVSVKIKAKKTAYLAKYFVLKASGNQRMIVVTESSSGAIKEVYSDEKKVIVNTNVSLQKYITHVNSEKITDSRRNRKANNGTINAICKNIPNSSGTNKYNDIVKIEAGDYVTYNIEVYNNSNINAQKVVVTDTLPAGATKYSINGAKYKSGSSFTHTINNIPAGEGRSFTVTAYFGEYKAGILENNAKITETSPYNKTSYRISDSDYVEMKKYSVSLEKFVTEVTSKEIENLTSTTDISKFESIIDYLEKNNINIDSLINQWNGKNINIDMSYDINQDNKIDDEDIAVFEKSKNVTKENIEEYINVDLNNDGHVDTTDTYIYKTIKANLEKDVSLNNYDRYMFILKSMYTDRINSNDALQYLYVQRLIIKTGKNQVFLGQDVDNYLKSDVNDDGYVNPEDNYIVESGNITINGEVYSLNLVTESINNLEQTKIEELRNLITKYDINNDQKINNSEIEFFKEYDGKYYNITQKKYQDIIKLKDAFKDFVKVEVNVDNFYYDFSGDSIIYFDDYILAKEDYEKYGGDELASVSDEINELLNKKYNAEYDFNEDNVVDHTDYEMLNNYINFIKFYHNYIQDQNRINELKSELIEIITIRNTESSYDSAYDLNGDNKIDFDDYIQAINNNEDEGIITGINNILTISNNSGKYNPNFDFNDDNTIDYLDFEFLTEYYVEIKAMSEINIDSFKAEIENLINNYSIFDKSSNDKDFTQEDINTINVYRGWKLYDENYCISNFENYSLYDINSDGLVNETDKNFITANEWWNISDNEDIKQIINEADIDGFITFFNENYNSNTLESLSRDEIVDTYNKLNAVIIDMNAKANVDEILSNGDYESKISNTTYASIENATKIDYKTLDANSDGKVDSNDIALISELFNITEFNKEEIITANDVNGDGQVDEDDKLFYEKLMEIKDNTSIKQAIIEVMNGTSTSGGQSSSLNENNVGDRSNHRHNESLADGDINKDTYKKENKVAVEPGDKITFTIRLKNTSTDMNVKISEIYDTFVLYEDESLSTNGLKLDYDETFGIQGNGGGYIADYHYKEENDKAKNLQDRYLIRFNNAITLKPGESCDVKIRFTLEVPQNITNKVHGEGETTTVWDGTVIDNKAGIVQIKNEKDIAINDLTNADSDTTDNNYDMDWLKTKIYKVSLEKYISKVNGNSITPSRDGNDTTSEDKSEHYRYDNDATTVNDWKYNNPVIVSNGDKVTYTIKVKNDGDTFVKITNIKDYLPDGIKYNNVTYNDGQYAENNKFDISFNTNNTIEFKEGISLLPGGSYSFTIEVEVIESNMSINIMKNVAEIASMENRNERSILDSTENNNRDADYIQMKDIVISGIVWNDKALNKIQDNYDGRYDSAQENKLDDGIKVYLHRIEDNKIVATDTTKDGGKYTFVLNHIKGPKASGTTRWDGTYYSYYVVFEYDGIKYTSTKINDTNNVLGIKNSNYLDSNAREKLNNEAFEGEVKESRTEFNNNHSTINNNSEISYNTKNEDGYIPQSIHTTSLTMQSSTQKITLSNNSALETQLQHINLGLRGRDIFDLELTSDVAQVRITVNNQEGVYNYSNRVTLRKSDLLSVYEDAANTEVGEQRVIGENEVKAEGVTTQNQGVRESDLDVSKANTNGNSYNKNQTLKSVFVTYKITVKNASITNGTATKITNYYDSKYTFVGAYANASDAEKRNNNKLGIDNNLSKDPAENEEYGYKTIITGWDTITQNNSKEIYVVYELKTSEFSNILSEGKMPTYNMAEITEYKTVAKDSANEATRGLIDKDSAPGSANREQVRTTETEGENTATTGGNPTTVEYYFSKKNNSNVDLSILKYEDDTYATPTLYFVADGTQRTITGTVFEDYTQIIDNDGEDQTIRVKTGDGKQLGDEPGIKGATVNLYEGEVGSGTLRYSVETDEKGSFTISGFLPGDYYIEYHYGDTDETFLLDNNPNTKSYNGEDFQSTNNTGKIAGKDYEGIKLYELNSTENFWYVYNESEGISTATDVSDRRKTVSTNVTGFSDDQMTVLNNARDGKKEAGVKDISVESIREATKMNALTKSMTLTVEKAIDSENQKDSFSNYVVSNMNFGIAEVPVTTIDLQKHVYSFEIKDSTGTNTLASAQKDLSNTAVTVNPSKIANNRIGTVIEILSKTLSLDYNDVENTINYKETGNINQNISIKTGLTKTEIDTLKEEITKASLAREIKIVQAWKVTAGNVIAAPGTDVIDVSIEDDKLQGAKLQITYEISANIYAEKNFNNHAVTVPSIVGIVDYVDNNLSYNKDSKAINGDSNSQFWTVAEQEAVSNLFKESAKYGEGNSYGDRLGTLDPEGTNYTTILSVNKGNAILRERCGEGKTYITLEKVLSSTDMTIQDIITSNVDIYEYQNSIEITSLNYKNQTESDTDTGSGNDETGSGSETGNGGNNVEDGTGNSGDGSSNGNEEFVYRDRIRTADRYIILPGIQHDSASSEIITIHPPTGDSNVNMVYLVIAIISLGVLAAGIFGIKKFVLKK